jgi:hypothetical protein
MAFGNKVQLEVIAYMFLIFTIASTFFIVASLSTIEPCITSRALWAAFLGLAYFTT